VVNETSDENILKVNLKRGDEKCISNHVVNEKTR
jgi:hypothetical protein